MAFAPAWQRSAVARCWQIAAPRAESASLPETALPVSPKPGRLTRRAEFLQAAQKGRKAAMPGLVLQVLPRDNADPVRVGFTVTKKVGNAVVRNRTRRRLREAACLLLRDAPLKGADLVLIGRDATRCRRFTLLIDDLRRALAKAGLAPAPKP